MTYENTSHFQQETVEREVEPYSFISLTQPREEDRTCSEKKILNSTDNTRKGFLCKSKLTFILTIVGIFVLAGSSSIISTVVLKQNIDSILTDMTNEIQEFKRNKMNGSWATWSSWKQCSVSCGLGLQRRGRNCTQPNPGLQGNPCVGDTSEYKVCSIGGCVGPMVYFTVDNPNRTLTTDGHPLFTRTIFNQGNGYNIEKAVFTCPVKGLYHFSVTQSSRSRTSCGLWYDKFIGHWSTVESNDISTASTSVYIHLNKGDTVDIRNCLNWQNVLGGDKSAFTGALIMPS